MTHVEKEIARKIGPCFKKNLTTNLRRNPMLNNKRYDYDLVII